MKNILFLVPYPHGKAPSQRFRFEQYYSCLKKNEFKIAVNSFYTLDAWKVLYHEGKYFKKSMLVFWSFIRRFFVLFKVSKYDLIFIHREATPLGPPIIEWMLAKVFRKKIIYDFDDAIWLEDFDKGGSLKSKLRWRSKIKHICKWSYKISVGNEYLAEYALQFNRNVFYNPTTVDTETHHNPSLYKAQKSKKITIGWTGTHSTMTYLDEIIPVIDRLEDKYDFDFLVISNRKPDFKLKSLKFKPWDKDSEIADLLNIDIGIMPLFDDEWSKGKCGFKLLQYMSLMIPAVASKIGANIQIIDHNSTGFLCRNNNEWRHYLELLLHDYGIRKNIGEAARQKVINHYSVEANKDNFLSILK